MLVKKPESGIGIRIRLLLKVLDLDLDLFMEYTDTQHCFLSDHYCRTDYLN